MKKKNQNQEMSSVKSKRVVSCGSSRSRATSRRRGGPILRAGLEEELRMLVPGGRTLRSEKLLLSRTVDYVAFLRFKLELLKAISDIYMP
ncbi:hypothetical protein QJS10_CPA05g01930 [Acorus calamus]|uniref:BHLH domain-containing protein n=1 Tax=Acorus calamus TaxID=4465 RepID=A0AAV9EU41_ACOCL|nr:hypothetical protein QJS10_CPA05g01930 [Acorus calamus]